MNYEKKYKEAQGWIEKIYPTLQHEQQMEAEAFFPELAESEDERIRKAIHIYLDWLDGRKDCQPKGDYTIKDMIAWLEKQNSNVDNANKEYWRGYREGKQEILDKYAELEKQDDINSPLVKQFLSNYYVEEVLEEPNSKKLEKQGEQKPIIEMKSAEESLGISSKEYNEIVNECLYGEQKPADRVEPKFKVEKGKWYVCIKDLLDNYANKAFCKGDTYLSTQDGSLIPSNSNVPFEVICAGTYFRDWTIQDAKDGDALCDITNKNVLIFNEISDGWVKCLCSVHLNNSCCLNCTELYGREEQCSFTPATKEQRDLLFSKMHEAGYEWDADKKDLKKISQRMISAEAKEAMYNKPAEWSEEDEVKINRIVACLENLNVADNDILLKDVDWLKSLRNRITWKPSEEQMKVFEFFIPYVTKCSVVLQKSKDTLLSLLADLKKLRKE